MAVKRKENVEDSLSRDRAHGLNIWATNCCAPTETGGSVGDNHGSHVLGPSTQSWRL